MSTLLARIDFGSSGGQEVAEKIVSGRGPDQLGDDEEGNGQKRPPRKKTPSNSENGPPNYLACPFWKLDPDQYWECSLKRVKRIRHLKRHLELFHTAQNCCVVCNAIFDTQIAMENHIRTRLCLVDAEERPGGISYTQSWQLSELSSVGTVEERWYEVWDILFPSTRRPDTIYQCRDTSELIRSMSEVPLKRAVRKGLQESGLNLRGDVSEEMLSKIIHSMLDNMFKAQQVRSSVDGIQDHPEGRSSTGRASPSCDPLIPFAAPSDHSGGATGNLTPEPDSAVGIQAMALSDYVKDAAWIMPDENLATILDDPARSLGDRSWDPSSTLAVDGSYENTGASLTASVDVHANIADSAYASASINHDCPRFKKEVEDANPQSHGSEQYDGQTDISICSVFDATRENNCMTALSREIHDQISTCWETGNPHRLFQRLPALIKAFALRLGREYQSGMDRDIMCFVYRKHQQIASEIEALAGHQDEPGSKLKLTDGKMSVPDKISLWSGMIDVDEAEKGVIFEGVESDDESDVAEFLPSDQYVTRAQDSKSYRWLISTLKRQASLSSNTNNMEDDIANSIAAVVSAHLLTGEVRRSLPPRIHSVEVRTSSTWEHMRRDVFSENWLGSLGKGLFRKSIVTTVNGLQAISCSVEKYAAIVWSLDFGVFLDELEAFILDEKRTTGSGALNDKTEFKLELRNSGYLHVTVSGLAFAISEFVQLLAWLFASFSRCIPHNELPAETRTPSLQWPKGLPWSLASKDISLKGENSVVSAKSQPNVQGDAPSPGADLHLEVGVQVSPVAPEPWNEAFRCIYLSNLPARLFGSIISGYPVPRLPLASTGVEISPELFSQLFGRIKLARGRQRIHGPYLDLDLVGMIDNVYYWHRSDLERTARRCTGHAELEETLKAKEARIKDSELGPTRHFLCACEKAPVEADVQDRNNSRSSPESAGRPSSPGSSIDPDMMSISSASEDVNRPDVSTSNFEFFNGVFGELVLLAVENAMAGQTAAPASDGNNPCQTQPSQPNSNAARDENGGGRQETFSSRKRRRNDGDCQDDDDNDPGRHPPKMPKQKHTAVDKDGRPVSLACPFWKLDSGKHWNCVVKKLDDISRVKMHLTRCHTPKHYCERCYTIFATTDLKKRHISSVPCLHVEGTTLYGISYEQREQLSHHQRGRTVEQKWHEVWAILFPDKPHPESIYQHPDQAEVVRQLHHLSRGPGLDVFIRRVWEDGRVLRPEATNDVLRDVFRLAMDSMSGYYHIQPSRAHPGTPTNLEGASLGGTSNSTASGPSNPSQSGGSDSGIMVNQQETSPGPIITGQSTISGPEGGLEDSLHLTMPEGFQGFEHVAMDSNTNGAVTNPGDEHWDIDDLTWGENPPVDISHLMASILEGEEEPLTS